MLNLKNIKIGGGNGFYWIYVFLNLVLFAFGYVVIQKILHIQHYSESINKLLLTTTQLNSISQKHFLHDLHDTVYFKNYNTKNVSEYERLTSVLNNNVSEILDSKMSYKYMLDDDIKKLLSDILVYNQNNKKINSITLYKGYYNYGLEGQMRNAAHSLESRKDLINDKLIFKLRRNEKDFLLRHYPQYIANVNATLDEIRTISKSKKCNNCLDSLLNNYSKSFNQISQTTLMLDSLQRVNSNLYENHINEALVKIVHVSMQKKDEFINATIFDFSIVSLIFIGSSIFFGFRLKSYNKNMITVLNNILKNLTRRNYSNTLQKDELIRDYNLENTVKQIDKLEHLLNKYRPEIKTREMYYKENFKIDKLNNTYNNFTKF